MFMTTTFIPVSRLLTADQPQLFHESASKPAPHLVASLGCHCGDASCSGRAVADAMQFKYRLRNTARLPSGFSGRFFQVFVAAAMDPEHMAESGHRITRPEFPGLSRTVQGV